MLLEGELESFGIVDKAKVGRGQSEDLRWRRFVIDGRTSKRQRIKQS